jgi:hypothetical protein
MSDVQHCNEEVNECYRFFDNDGLVFASARVICLD